MNKHDSIKWTIYPYLFVFICLLISEIFRFFTHRQSRR